MAERAREGATLRDRVLAAAKSLPQPFLVPDVREHVPEVTASTIFHELRDLQDDGIVSWSDEGYRYVG